MDPSFSILLVEDDADCRSAIGDLLELSGHAVVLCGDAEHALAQARRVTPALALIDLHLPGRDGAWLVGALAAEGPPLSEVPVLLTTGSVDARAVAERLGVGLIEKPFDANRLLARVEKVAQNPLRRAARPPMSR